jgi:protein-disulfide isomerase
MEPSNNVKNSIAVPVAIVFGFTMIAIAIFFTGGDREPTVVTQAIPEAATETSTPRPVDNTDYIKGNPNAPILIIEYSDYDCPFCKQYHETLTSIIDEFGANGRVAWVYRQFPIAQLHPNSPKISEAALCVGEIGGQTAFWNFSDSVFASRELNEFTNITKLPEFASLAGVSVEQFQSCYNSGRMEEKVLASAEEAFKIGARGTPHTVVMVGNQQAVVNGAQSYDVVRSIIENLIQQLDGTFNPNSVQTPTPTS